MGIDYGDSRTGISVCDKLEILATPVETIYETYDKKLISKINEIKIRLGAEKAILGLPVNMDGSEGPRAEKCRAFGKELEILLGIPVILQDERLTTAQASRNLDITGTFGKKRKKVIDAESAVLILQSYMDKNRQCQEK